MIGALLALALAAPTPEAALAEILPKASNGLVQRLGLPGLPRPGPGVSFAATPAAGSTAELLIADLVARRDGAVIYARRVTVPLRTRLRVPVPTRHLPRGTIVGPDDFALREVHVPSPALVVTEPASLIGREVRRPLTAGRPVPRRSVEDEKIVGRGDQVQVAFVAPGFRIEMEARALEPGAIGDVVRVINSRSNEIVSARVVDRGKLEVVR